MAHRLAPFVTRARSARQLALTRYPRTGLTRRGRRTRRPTPGGLTLMPRWGPGAQGAVPVPAASEASHPGVTNVNIINIM